MSIFILGKEHYISKSGKEVFKLHCGRVICSQEDGKEQAGMSVFTAFTNQNTYDKLVCDLKSDYDLAVFFKENGFHNVYLKKGE